MYVAMYVKQKQPGCKKSARPIRSSIVRSYSYKQPKSLIYKVRPRKSFYLNDIQ